MDRHVFPAIAGDYGLAAIMGATVAALEGHVEGLGLLHYHKAATLLASELYDLKGSVTGNQDTMGETAGS